MELPKRSGPYILALLMAVLAALTLWMLRAVTAPEVLNAARKRKWGKTEVSPGLPVTPKSLER